jgi:carboxyl-terminal processing protease
VEELDKALKQLGPLQGLILDLRQDPGGLLEEAVGVADRFLPKGAVIVSQHGRASPEKVYSAVHGNGGRKYPMVVLVDRGTASAAEIVSGALQDHDRGLVAGENTFGKGLVQTVFSLSDKTGLALTTAKYYTPSGRLIQRNYEGVSLYDYYYHQSAASGHEPKREAKTTDIGRTVYGGDGITPDVAIAPPKGNAFQDNLLEHYAFFDYAQQYVREHNVTQRWAVDAAVLADFRNFLKQREVSFAEPEWAANLDWLQTNVKAEIFSDQFGESAGLRVRVEMDSAVQQAIALLPRAQALQQKAGQVAAERARRATMAQR